MAAPVGYTKLPEPSAGHQNAADVSSNGLARVVLKIGSPLGMTAFFFDTPFKLNERLEQRQQTQLRAPSAFSGTNLLESDPLVGLGPEASSFLAAHALGTSVGYPGGPASTSVGRSFDGNVGTN